MLIAALGAGLLLGNQLSQPFWLTTNDSGTFFEDQPPGSTVDCATMPATTTPPLVPCSPTLVVGTKDGLLINNSNSRIEIQTNSWPVGTFVLAPAGSLPAWARLEYEFIQSSRLELYTLCLGAGAVDFSVTDRRTSNRTETSGGSASGRPMRSFRVKKGRVTTGADGTKFRVEVSQPWVISSCFEGTAWIQDTGSTSRPTAIGAGKRRRMNLNTGELKPEEQISGPTGVGRPFLTHSTLVKRIKRGQK